MFFIPQKSPAASLTTILTGSNFDVSLIPYVGPISSQCKLALLYLLCCRVIYLRHLQTTDAHCIHIVLADFTMYCDAFKKICDDIPCSATCCAVCEVSKRRS